MSHAKYIGEILQDGHLSLPRKVKKKLNLKNGLLLEVKIRKLNISEGHAVKELRLLGLKQRQSLKDLIGKGNSQLTDISKNHDKYLYK